MKRTVWLDDNWDTIDKEKATWAITGEIENGKLINETITKITKKTSSKAVSKTPTVYRGSLKAEQNLHQQLKTILQNFDEKKISFEEALKKGLEAIDGNQAVISEIARKKASKDLGLETVELSPEMSARLKTFRDETVESFKQILEDSKS